VASGERRAAVAGGWRESGCNTRRFGYIKVLTGYLGAPRCSPRFMRSTLRGAKNKNRVEKGFILVLAG
jgi:hypothetical protein